MNQTEDADLDHLAMLYPELVDRAMRSQEPVADHEWIGDHRFIVRAAQFDPDTETVWRANIDVDTHPEYDTPPSVGFSKCYPLATEDWLQTWTALATGRLSGPQKLPAWETMFVVFNAALTEYHAAIGYHNRRCSHPGGSGDGE